MVKTGLVVRSDELIKKTIIFIFMYLGRDSKSGLRKLKLEQTS